MKIGSNIKKLRELKNYTQAHMARELQLSVGAYGNIERDETDITIQRLNQIASILETNLETILNFDSNNIFNQTHNNMAYGIVQNQQVFSNDGLKTVFTRLNDDIENLKNEVNKLKETR
jgi:transcriptional regulator with XRE-family HTH domain